MTFGLTPTGFVPKSVQDVLAEIEADERSGIDALLDTSAESVVGQLNAIMAPKIAELWELAAIVSSARDPRFASFDALDAVAELTGIVRRADTAGQVILTVALNAGTMLPAGSVAHVAGQPDNRWVTAAAVANTGASPADFTVQSRASATGPITANSGTITVIATPVSGWTAVTNALDAVPGSLVETDAQLRLRRVAELDLAATSPVDAIRADLLALTNVDGTPLLRSVTVEENASSFPDSQGRPPKIVEAIVQIPAGLSGPEITALKQRVVDTLWHSKAGGIDTYGAESGVALDSLGVARTVHFSEPDEVPVTIAVELTVDAGYIGDTAVKQACVDFANALLMGQDLVRARLICALVELAGVLDVVSLTLATASVPAAPANLHAFPRTLFTIDSGDVSVST